jgi:hypothetical protein
MALVRRVGSGRDKERKRRGKILMSRGLGVDSGSLRMTHSREIR